MRFERRERIGGDLGSCGRDPRDQGGLACVGKTDQTDVRQQFQLEAKIAFLTRTAFFMFPWRLMPGTNKFGIAVSASPAAPTSGAEPLPSFSEVKQLLAG